MRKIAFMKNRAKITDATFISDAKLTSQANNNIISVNSRYYIYLLFLIKIF